MIIGGRKQKRRLSELRNGQRFTLRLKAVGEREFRKASQTPTLMCVGGWFVSGYKCLYEDAKVCAVLREDEWVTPIDD